MKNRALRNSIHLLLLMYDIRFKKEIKESKMEDARKDGVVMEQTSASPYVANIFGVCGVTQMVEYSDQGTLHDLVKVARQRKRDTMGPLDKLKIAIHIASAVTDLHEVAGATHGDLCMNQYLFVGGVYKLNDFHMSEFVRQDDNDRTCFDSVGFARGVSFFCYRGQLFVGPLYLAFISHVATLVLQCASVHAPEERDWKDVDLQKADVYMMGNVMYYVYTKNFLYEGIPDKDALTLLYNGKRSPFPTGLDTTIPANAAVQSAIQKCWTHDPEQRPTARFIRDSLLKEFSAIVGRPVQPGDDILMVQIPSLPKYYRFTDSSSFDTVNDNVKKHDPMRIKYNNEI